MVVVVPVTVPPSPVLLLIFGREFAEIAMWIAVIFACPLVVIDHLAVVPFMVVGVVRVIDAIGMMFCASRPKYGNCQGGCQEN